MKQINGLLTQKPTSPEPQVGDVRRFSYQERTSKTGTPWIKIKAEGDGYGEPYEIKTVRKTDYVDQHGNVSFNINIEPVINHGAPYRPGIENEEGDQSADWPSSVPEGNEASSAPIKPNPPSKSSDGIMEAKKHLLASAKLYNLCVDAARTVVEDHAKEFWPDGLGGEMFRTCVSSLFIEATRAGMLEKMK